MPRQIPGVILGLAILALVAAAAAVGELRNTLFDLLLLVPAAGAYVFMVRNWFSAPDVVDDEMGPVVSEPSGPGPLRWLMRAVGLALVVGALCLAGGADFFAYATGRTALVLGAMLAAGFLMGRK